jgi:NADH:ubiquinone oxidoreductase subunit 6 (subunit J)
MSVTFACIVLFTLVPAAVAMALRNLIHSALLLIASWAGIAAFYLWAGAEFVAFAQVLVYVGAVSMIVLFAVLLTRHMRGDTPVAFDALGRVLSALIVGGAVLGVFFGAVLSTRLNVQPDVAPRVTVKELGTQLAGPHAAALLIVGVLLTVALLGGIVLAASDREQRPEDRR